MHVYCARALTLSIKLPTTYITCKYVARQRCYVDDLITAAVYLQMGRASAEKSKSIM